MVDRPEAGTCGGESSTEARNAKCVFGRRAAETVFMLIALESF